MKTLLREFRDVVVSLKLTILLLVFSMILVFAATLDQVNLGIWAVQEKYFRSFVVYVQAGQATIPAFPGGYTVGGLLLINLVAAHLFRFRFEWKKVGIILTHLGLIVLLVGELLTGLWQEDAHLRLTEGETKNYAESSREYELALIDTSDAAHDLVVSIPEAMLARKIPVQMPQLPFRVVTKLFYPNSTLVTRPSEAGASPSDAAKATAGAGQHLMAAPQPVTAKSDERNVPSAIVELIGTEGSLGSYLVSAQLPMAQSLNYGGHEWKIVLRVKRLYQPFSLTLLKFSHDRYAGTDIPKNFSSRLRLNAPDGKGDREVLVYMNNPLRHGGLTFYQAGFENDDRTTILQVVRNPSWLVPYVACGLMTLGLCVQFSIHLGSFLRRRVGVTAAATPTGASAKQGTRPASIPQTI